MNDIELTPNPRVGMMAIVRGKRRAVISEVRPFLGDDQMLHVVRLEYKDDQYPESEELIWEREPSRRLLEPTSLPNFSDPAMPIDDFDALLSAARWSALSPYLDPDEDGPLERMPICSPFHGAVQVEDYQLVPLLKALKMPRINLMIADDVGLGKTIEAGLILRELLIRRRVQRVMILTPASLRVQWHDEMWSKFSLRFDVIDRASTQQLKKSMGIDANPWRSSYRAISSYYYLRQPDVLEQFRSANQTPEGSPNLPWDLLIVDEVHNLMPSLFGEDSDLCKTLRAIAPYFEHRIFLTATPHNGRTQCFTGLMEILDPVRFTRTDELKPAERERISQVVIRRLKRDINKRTNPPKFSTRMEPKALILAFSKSEKRLISALGTLRDKIRLMIKAERGRRKIAGTFAIQILSKRLLSGPATFANTWMRCKMGLAELESATDSDVNAAQKSLDDETGDDQETERRSSTATIVIGAWLRDFAERLQIAIADVDSALTAMGIDLNKEADQIQFPKSDARIDTLLGLIKDKLLANSSWRDDERLVVFTEYKTTLDYLVQKLQKTLPDASDRVLTLYGGMDDRQREQVKEKFNDQASPMRILVATDAASEGLNLQNTARYLIHYDCPWNPSRIEQRNGRLDRHGQARDVQTYHFASDEDSDLRFMSILIQKVDRVREDLGAVSELFDEALHRRLIEGDDTDAINLQLESRIEQAKGKADLPADNDDGYGEAERGLTRLKHLASEVALSPHAQRRLLDVAMGIQTSRPQVSEPDENQCCKLLNPGLPAWSDVIDETVRRGASGGRNGPVPLITFSSDPFLLDVGGRTVFRPNPNIEMIHLGHPLMSQALNTVGQRRYPGGKSSVSRWTSRFADVPLDCDALILLHLEEIGVNELRETFHHWVRTIVLPLRNGVLGSPLPHRPADQLPKSNPNRNSKSTARAAEWLGDVESELQSLMKTVRVQLTENLKNQLSEDGKEARKEEDRRYQSRHGEVSALIESNTVQKLEREIQQLVVQKNQGMLFDHESYLDDLNRDIKLKQQEVEFRRKHYEEVRDQLALERDRVVNRLLPKRFTFHGEAQVFPLAVEIYLPFPKGGVQ